MLNWRPHLHVGIRAQRFDVTVVYGASSAVKGQEKVDGRKELMFCGGGEGLTQSATLNFGRLRESSSSWATLR